MKSLVTGALAGALLVLPACWKTQKPAPTVEEPQKIEQPVGGEVKADATAPLAPAPVVDEHHEGEK
jgi:hypothetical protein